MRVCVQDVTVFHMGLPDENGSLVKQLQRYRQVLPYEVFLFGISGSEKRTTCVVNLTQHALLFLLQEV